MPPRPQAFPQAPQLRGSIAVTVQLPWQASKAGGQAATQASSIGEQTSPPAHTVEHDPQWLGSFLRTQVPPHRCSAMVHWHCPPTQLPPLHELPHPPHELESVWGLTHNPWHERKPAGQPATQRPWLHVSPASHATPHPPQFSGSLPKVTQAPPQSAPPPGQTQAPETHDWPAAQRVPQLPQLAGSVEVSAQLHPVLVHTHGVFPAAHTHFPSLQVAPDGQAFPQAPQLVASL